MSQGNPDMRDDPLAEASATNVPRATVTSQALPSGTSEKIATSYNMKSPAVKRILREAAENAKEDRTVISAAPLDDNIFEWHFTIRGPPDTPFELGMYHGRIILPSNYPMSPPNIMLLNPSGRFDVNTKICLSISSYHPESWQPSWSILTALTALRSFMATDSPGAIGSIQYSDEIRKEMARKSRWFECSCCGFVFAQLDSINIDERPEVKTVPKDLRQKVEAHLSNSVTRQNANSSSSVMIPYPRPELQLQPQDCPSPVERVESLESIERNLDLRFRLSSSHSSFVPELDIQLIENSEDSLTGESTRTADAVPAVESRPLSTVSSSVHSAASSVRTATSSVRSATSSIRSATSSVRSSPSVPIEEASEIPPITAPQSPPIPRYITDMAIATVVVLIGIIIVKRMF